jgi:flagellar biosynthesis/type III secretory pathway protein FliH
MEEIVNPHDKLFRETWSDLATAKSFLRHYLNNIDDVSADDLTRILKASLSEKKGEVVMTLAEKLRKEGFEKGLQQGVQKGVQQGMRQGFIEGIELAVTVKFTDDAFKIVPLIYQIEDISVLKAVKSALMTVKSADELIDIIKSLK